MAEVAVVGASPPTVESRHQPSHNSRGASEALDRVWELFSLAWELTGGASLLLEWDSDIPEFGEYHAELLKAREYMQGDIGFQAEAMKAATTQETVSNPVSFMVSDAAERLAT